MYLRVPNFVVLRFYIRGKVPSLVCGTICSTFTYARIRESGKVDITMVTFLFTVAVLSAFIFVGYALNMYLYTQGVARVRSRAFRRVASFSGESFSVQPVYEAEQREMDYGSRYARVGIMLIIGILAFLILTLIVVLSMVLR